MKILSKYKFLSKLILCITLICMTGITNEANAQIKPNITPVKFSVYLLDQPDINQAEEIFKFYGLSKVSKTDSTFTYKTKDSEYTYKVIPNSQFPEMTIITSYNLKELENQLRIQNFKKHSHNKKDPTIIYEKGSSYLPQSIIVSIKKGAPYTLKISKKKNQ